MKKTHTLFGALALALILTGPLLQTGCASLENAAEKISENSGPLTKALVSSGLRVITYGIASNNPEFAPAIYGISGAFLDLNATLEPDSVRSIVGERVQDLVDPGDRQLAGLIVNEALSLYEQVYLLYDAEEDIIESELQLLLASIAQSIQAGVSLAGAPPDVVASPDPSTIELDRVTVIIR